MTVPPIPNSIGMLQRPKKPRKITLAQAGRGNPGMAGKKPNPKGWYRPILPPGQTDQAVLGPAVGPTVPTKEVLAGAMLSMPIPDRVGDQQRKRWQQEMDIRESGWGRDGGPSIDDTPARIPNPHGRPYYPGIEDSLSYPSDNPRARRGKKGSRWD